MKLFSELKRRNVIRVAAAYLVASWLLIEAVSLLSDIYAAPDWVPRLLVGLLMIGFPIALFFSWAFELTPEGLKPESEVDHSTSIAQHTAKRLDVITIVLLVLVVGIVGAERLTGENRGQTPISPAHNAAVDGSGNRSLTPISIAVLPFANMSADAENEYFADGISEEILNLLAGVKDLSVASRTSAFGFKGKDTPIPEIARQLEVRYVLEGSVRKAGDQVRITAQLIDASNDRHLWSQTYDRKLDDIFAIQDEIAGAIGDALQVELLGAGGQRITAEAIDPEVYAQFLEARHLLRRRSREDLSKANQMLIDVVDAEPDFARGHVVLAEAYLLNSSGGASQIPWEIGAAQARIHAMRAQKLDPTLSGIELVLGSLAGDVLTTLAHYARAIELERDEPRAYHWRGIVYGRAGYLDLAREDLETAVRLEPTNANAWGWLATVETAEGNYQRALEHSRKQSELGNPAIGKLFQIHTLIRLGDLDAADRVAQEIPDCNTFCRNAMEAGAAYARGELALAELKTTLLDSDTRQPFIATGLLTALGEGEALLEWFETNQDFRFWAGQIWADNLRDMRRDPRFVALIEEAGLTELWRELGPPPDCRAEGETFVCGYGYGEGT